MSELELNDFKIGLSTSKAIFYLLPQNYNKKLNLQPGNLPSELAENLYPPKGRARAHIYVIQLFLVMVIITGVLNLLIYFHGKNL